MGGARMTPTANAALPLEHFIQAVQRQLDNAQTAMAVKARNLNLPLTFAIKDITLDLRAQVEFVGVRTVDKLQEMSAQGGDRTVGRVTSLPVDRLRRALERASAPLMEHVMPVLGGGEGDLPLLRVSGRNLTRSGPPRVTLGGE